jgi:DNA polymerase-4
MLRLRFGIAGDILHQMGHGTYFSPIIAHHSRPDAKSMGHAYTLDRNTRDTALLERHLLRLSEMVGRRLREDGYSGRTVTLTLRFANLQSFNRQRSLADHLDDGYDIYRSALPILHHQLERDKRAIRLIGVCVSNLIRGHQLGLFVDERKKDALKAMDAINDRFGEFTIRRASLLNLKVREKTHGFEGKDMK